MKPINARKASTLLLCLAVSISAFGQEVVTDPGHTAATIANQAENHASWLEQLETAWSNLEQAQMALEEAKENHAWVRAGYELASFSKTYGPAIRNLYNTYDDFESTYRNSLTTARDAYRSGYISASDMGYIVRSGAKCQQIVTGSFSTFMDMMKSDMAHEQRLKLLNGLCYTIEEQDNFIKQIDAKIQSIRREREARRMVDIMASGKYDIDEIPDEELTDFETLYGSNSVYIDKLWIEAINKEASDPDTQDIRKKMANRRNDTRTLDNLPSTQTTVDSALNFASWAIAIILLLSLPMALARRLRGERQANDAIYKVYAAMIFAVIGLQILKLIL